MLQSFTLVNAEGTPSFNFDTPVLRLTFVGNLFCKTLQSHVDTRGVNLLYMISFQNSLVTMSFDDDGLVPWLHDTIALSISSLSISSLFIISSTTKV